MAQSDVQKTIFKDMYHGGKSVNLIIRQVNYETLPRIQLSFIYTKKSCSHTRTYR